MTTSANVVLTDGTSDRLFLPTDLIVYGVIFAIGILEFVSWQRINDFYRGDSEYVELARALIRDGLYRFNFKPETLLPPGFPMILAFLCVTVGCTPAILMQSISIFVSLGFVAGYRLLRIEQGCALAAASCLLMASSPIMFALSTQVLFADLPYFFASMLTLLLAHRLDSSKGFRARTVSWLLCAVLLVGSLLIRTAGIALLTGLVGWLAASWFVERRGATRRIKTFLPLLFLGMSIQGLWMNWSATQEVDEWPTVIGYPHSYFAQLRVKDGNYPELGYASLSDIPQRVMQNLTNEAAALSELFSRMGYIAPTWFSPAVFLPVLLILLGVGSSIRHGGGNWPAWYFVTYEMMYLLWPWNFEVRFLLPVAPLAFLYLWRGGKVLLDVVSRKTVAVGITSFFLAIFLGLSAGVSAWRTAALQPEIAAIFWAMTASVGAGMVWWRRRRFASTIVPILTPSSVVKIDFVKSLASGGGISLAILIVLGVVQDFAVRRENLNFDLRKQASYPYIAAAQWIKSHTPVSNVVMARFPAIVHYYSEHRIVWFPPSSNPRLLMEGIRKYKVESIIVTNKTATAFYWLPSEQDSFEKLVRAYPMDFLIAHEEAQFKIYSVVPQFPGAPVSRRMPHA